MSNTTPAGWYPDSQNTGQQRYWDGTRWTEHTAPLVGSEPPRTTPETHQGTQPFATPLTPSPKPPRSKEATRNTWLAVGGVALLVGGCTIGVAAAGAGDDPTEAASVSSTVTVTATVEETATVTPEVAPETPDAVPVEPPSESPKAKKTKKPPATFVMPSLVGMVLQDAQDRLQLEGSYLLTQTDATGLERFQIDDSNWKVCYQIPAAGTEVRFSRMIDLGAVKLDEQCP
jgi:hypothetical protein